MRFSGPRYHARIPLTVARQALHNAYGIFQVWDLILLRPLPHGLLAEDHPFCTGVSPGSGDTVWDRNIVYRSGAGARWEPADRRIVRRVGRYMAGMVRCAAGSPRHPAGRPTRMPAAIYFIHGGVHFNGGWLVFDDFADAIRHLTHERFLAELRRFVRVERREPLLVFRSADYDADEYARFVGFVRTVLPWFANSNGARTPPIWGNAAPYPTVNIVTGSWIRDVRLLTTREGQRLAPRPAIQAEYFASPPYFGERDRTLPIEDLHARVHAARIRARGERGNVYFVDRRDMERGVRHGPDPAPTLWSRMRTRLRSSARSSP